MDYLEYLLVLALIFLSPQQWQAIRLPLLWRMLAQTKQSLKEEFGDETSSAANEDNSDKANAEGGNKEVEEKSMDDSTPPVTKTSDSSSKSLSLDVLRPILLFWSLVDSIHSLVSPPSDSNYTASSSDAFLASTGSATLRRWSSRRSLVRNSQIAIFRSIMRREHDILTQLTETVLPSYEKRAASKETQTLVEMIPTVRESFDQQGITTKQIVDNIFEGITHTE